MKLLWGYTFSSLWSHSVKSHINVSELFVTSLWDLWYIRVLFWDISYYLHSFFIHICTFYIYIYTCLLLLSLLVFESRGAVAAWSVCQRSNVIMIVWRIHYILEIIGIAICHFWKIAYKMNGLWCLTKSPVVLKISLRIMYLTNI